MDKHFTKEDICPISTKEAQSHQSHPVKKTDSTKCWHDYLGIGLLVSWPRNSTPEYLPKWKHISIRRLVHRHVQRRSDNQNWRLLKCPWTDEYINCTHLSIQQNITKNKKEQTTNTHDNTDDSKTLKGKKLDREGYTRYSFTCMKL